MKLYPLLLAMLVIVATIILCSFSAELKADNTSSPIKIIPTERADGTVTFQVLTVTNHGSYSPRNIGAIWVTTESGTFVKTLQRWGNNYLQYLTRWHAATSSGNTTGAVTGATLSSHSTHNLTWNCRNTSNVQVADGNYKIWVEFTETNGAGPYTSVTFTKGASAVHLTPANTTYFHNVVLNFTPTTTVGPPLNLTSSVVVPNHVTLNWAPPTSTSGLTGYKVYRDGTLINSPSATTTTYADTPAIGSHSYYVTAMFGTTESAHSNTTTVTISATIVPPRNLVANVTTSNSVNLSWTAPTSTFGLTAYRVYRDGTLRFTTPNATTLTYTDTPTTQGNHSYYITAMFGTTQSGQSNTATVTITDVSDGTQSPVLTTLLGNYPNPFKPETRIRFSLAKNQSAHLSIYNVKGQKVRDLKNGNLPSGLHEVTWNGTDDNGVHLSSGFYFYKLETSEGTVMKKMLMLK